MDDLLDFLIESFFVIDLWLVHDMMFCYTSCRRVSNLHNDGGRTNKLSSFSTVSYAQANILLCATNNTPKKEPFEQVRMFQDSLDSARPGTSEIIRQATGQYILILDLTSFSAMKLTVQQLQRSKQFLAQTGIFD